MIASSVEKNQWQEIRNIYIEASFLQKNGTILGFATFCKMWKSTNFCRNRKQCSTRIYCCDSF